MKKKSVHAISVTLRNLEIISNTQKDAYSVYANMTPFSERDLSIHASAILLTTPFGYRGCVLPTEVKLAHFTPPKTSKDS